MHSKSGHTHQKPKLNLKNEVPFTKLLTNEINNLHLDLNKNVRYSTGLFYSSY